MISLYPEAPAYQDTDTSKAAAVAVSGRVRLLRERCLRILQADDHTADEVAALMGESVLAVRPRIAELNASHQVFDSGKRRKNASGHAAIVWTTKQQGKLL